MNCKLAFPRVELLDVPICDLSSADLISVMVDSARREETLLVTYANVYGMNLAWKQPWFTRFYQDADVVFCDGVGVQWGARLAGKTLHNRQTPPDWIESLALAAAENELSLFLLGGQPGIAEKAAGWLQSRVPGLVISGCYHGYFEKTPGAAQNEAVLEKIRIAQPSILLVGFGMPLQEEWIREYREQIRCSVIMTVGALFDWISGEKKRGPRWMTNNGLEWLSRLILEPGRLWRRYIIGNPLFLLRVLLARVGLSKKQN
ncbi:MAG: WecB/TagA/CpsF family glycosyltransferase [Anaerolineales bacterium]|nr:WecB/TagA/CpsF family glycosyltransferase [Anaerolineales bacterium]